MQKIKKFISRHFAGFVYFYKHLGYRMFIVVIFSILLGILDGFGLSMFLPLLQLVSDSSSSIGDTGGLNFVVIGIQNLGLPLTLSSILLLMLLFFVLKGVMMFFVGVYNVSTKNLFVKEVRKKLLDLINSISYIFFVQFDIGRIQNTMTGEVDRLTRAYREYLHTIEQLMLVLVYSGFAFLVNWKFAISVSIGGLLTNLIYNQIYKRTKSASRSFTSDSHDYQGYVLQHIGNFKYLKSTGLLHRYSNKLDMTIDVLEFNRRKIGVLAAFVRAVKEPVLIGVVSLVILIQVNFFGENLGAILISLLFFYRALSSVLSMQNYWNNYLEVSGSIENVIDFEKELKKNTVIEGVVDLIKFEDNVTLQNVCFKYNEVNVLKNINLIVKKNETIAFVGHSGSGKTTLVNMLCGLLPPSSGDLVIDNVNRIDLNTLSYQKRIGYITQEAVVFNDTVFNNVTFWDVKNQENIEKCKQALHRAAMLDVVLMLPNQLDSELGSHGVNLSGGQKQRISIARELYKDIDILILDEATSALDSETERIIQTQIEQIKGKYTIFIVAHRLSTVKNADRIVFLANGSIVSIGSFDELMMKNTEFRALVHAQGV